MSAWLAFGLGLVMGSCIGVVVVALCVASRHSWQMDEWEALRLREVERAADDADSV